MSLAAESITQPAYARLLPRLQLPLAVTSCLQPCSALVDSICLLSGRDQQGPCVQRRVAVMLSNKPEYVHTSCRCACNKQPGC